MNDPRDFLLELLTVIDYKEDKEVFVDEFVSNVRLQSLLDLIRSLPSEKQTQIKEQFASVSNNPDKIAGVLESFFQEAQIQEVIANATTKAMNEWLKALEPTLTTAQRTKLTNLFEDLTRPSSI